MAGETGEFAAVRRLIANAIERSDDEPYDENDDVYLLNADAVIAALDLGVCCVVCGMDESDCTGQDHGEYAHDYAPLVFVQAPHFGSSEDYPDAEGVAVLRANTAESGSSQPPERSL